MTAQVTHLDAFRKERAPAPATAARFSNFAQVMQFELPEPTWVSADLTQCTYAREDREDREGLEAFFRGFGVSVNVHVLPEAIGYGWQILGEELGPAATWKTKHPDTFEAVCGRWPAEQLRYLEAVMSGDHELARELVFRTSIGLRLREKMQTPRGSALK